MTKKNYGIGTLASNGKPVPPPVPSPPTLHAKPAVKFASPSSADKPEHRASSITTDTDDDDNSSYTPLHYRMTIDDDPEDDDNDDPEDNDSQNDDTMDDPEDNDDPKDNGTSLPFASTSAIAPTPAALAAIFTDVTRQLDTRTDDDMNGTRALNDDDMNGRRALLDDISAIARMDAHVRAILTSADPMLYALNTTLGHTATRTSPSPLTDETMAAEIAEMYAHYYADTSSSEDESLFP